MYRMLLRNQTADTIKLKAQSLNQIKIKIQVFLLLLLLLLLLNNHVLVRQINGCFSFSVRFSPKLQHEIRINTTATKERIDLTSSVVRLYNQKEK